MVVNHGKIKRVPLELIKEANTISQIEGCSFTDACRRMGKDYSPIGREIKGLTTGKLIRNILNSKLGGRK